MPSFLCIHVHMPYLGNPSAESMLFLHIERPLILEFRGIFSLIARENAQDILWISREIAQDSRTVVRNSRGIL